MHGAVSAYSQGWFCFFLLYEYSPSTSSSQNGDVASRLFFLGSWLPLSISTLGRRLAFFQISLLPHTCRKRIAQKFQLICAKTRRLPIQKLCCSRGRSAVKSRPLVMGLDLSFRPRLKLAGLIRTRTPDSPLSPQTRKAPHQHSLKRLGLLL